MERPICNIRISRLALASMAIAWLILLCLLSLILISQPRVASPSPFTTMLAMLIPLGLLLALVFGVISLANISLSGGTLTGKGYAITGILLSCMIFAVGIILPAMARCRGLAFHMTCGTNLSGMGKAMLIYANDYDDELPKAGALTNSWARTLPNHGWQANSRSEAFDISKDKGQITATSCLYLLIKYAEVTPKQFVCKQDKKRSEFILSKLHKSNDKKLELIDLWDFGPNPEQHCSYAYHWPFDDYALTTTRDPSLAVAADRNPWLTNPKPEQNTWDSFLPDNEKWQGNLNDAIKGNSPPHHPDGQNVLFMDSHVSFERRSFCGFNDDNIYTSAEREDPNLSSGKGQGFVFDANNTFTGKTEEQAVSSKGLRPVRFDMSPSNRPKSKLDSYLVQ